MTKAGFESSDDFDPDMKLAAEQILARINNEVLNPIYRVICKDPSRRPTLNPAFPFPRLLRIGFLRKGIAIEYVGPEKENEDRFLTQVFHQPNTSPLEFVGVDLGQSWEHALAFEDVLPNTNFYLGDSLKRLHEYHYDVSSASEAMAFGGYFDIEKSEEVTCYSNVSFCWTTDEGELKVRHIDFLEYHPGTTEGYQYFANDKGTGSLVNAILGNTVPQFDVKMHQTLNAFIEILHESRFGETDITSFLERNPGLLKLGLGAFDLNPQVLLEWQCPTDVTNLKPDFLPRRMGGFSDIVDFKLPRMKSRPMVGKDTRRQPSFEVDEAIAQLALYDEYCAQAVNRRWLEETHGIKVLNPTRTVVIGNSKEFPIADRQRLRSQRNTIVHTYDELIELIRNQLYTCHGES